MAVASAAPARPSLPLMLMLMLMPALAVVAAGEVMKGISYGPMPLKGTGLHIPLDDFMSDSAKPLWGSRGRGDLAIMRQLGANVVRLYGNDPRQPHAAFLDEARALGLGVIPGLSDWPYTQMQGSCAETGYNCYDQVKESFAGNLKNGGWLVESGAYHPALQQVIVVNEPDLKLPGMHDPVSYSRAIISAVDGMLAAEDEAGVFGDRINFTVTFSFGLCENCLQSELEGNKPALGQMLELRRAFFNPQAYGYTPQHDLAAFYTSRFTNSFNTANPSDELPSLFLDAYEAEFPTVPVFIGEFHSVHPPRDQSWDVWNMIQIAENRTLLQGISFFEFQVRYDKGGSEMDFGMFGLGSYSFGQFDFFGHTYDIWCLVPITNDVSQYSLPDSLTWAYGGQVLQTDLLCQADPEKVPLTSAGFAQILALGDADRMAAFVARVVRHAGGEVLDQGGLVEFSRGLTSWEAMQAGLKADLTWLSWDPLAACVADRQATEGAVGLAIEKACNSTLFFNCANVPSSCKNNTWDTADYVLSVYYMEAGQDALSDCYWDGAATMARVTDRLTNVSECVVSKDAQTTPLTDEGYQAVVLQGSPESTSVFIRRVVEEEMNAIVTNSSALAELAALPPDEMSVLRSVLQSAAWVCTDGADLCSANESSTVEDHPTDSTVVAEGANLAWRIWAFVGLGAVVLITIVGTVVHVRCKGGGGCGGGGGGGAPALAAGHAVAADAPAPVGDQAA